MTKDDLARLIPDAVVEAAAIHIAEGRLPEYSWGDLDAEMKAFYRDEARAAIAAGLAAWPGGQEETGIAHFSTNRTSPVQSVPTRRFILPLPPEPKETP